MNELDGSDQEPLLSWGAVSPAGYNGIAKSRNTLEASPQETYIHHSVEDDVLPENAVLGRNLGWSSAYILIISRVIGSGIFATPGTIVKSVGSIGLTLVLWVVGALVAWCGLAVSLEYGCMLPRSGGEKVYLEFTYRRPRFLASTLVAVQAVLLGFTASNCIVFGEYVLFALGKESTALNKKVLAAGLLTAITIMHSCFLKTGIFIQNVLGWIKIGLMFFMVFTSLFVVLLHSHGDSSIVTAPSIQSVSWESLWSDSVWNWGIISTALFKVFYSYAGLQNVSNVLNEVKNPVKTLKSASTAGLVTACILYLLVNIAYFIVVPIQDIKNSGELIAALFFERIFGPTLGRILLPLSVALSVVGNVSVVTFALARLNQEIARQGFLPFSRLLSSSRPFNAPMGGLIVHYIPSLLVITIPTGNVYSFILDVEGYPAQFFGLATSLGLIWLRFKRPDLDRPYKAFLPAVGMRVVLSLALIAAPFVPRENEDRKSHLFRVSYAFVGIGIILFGLVYWYIWTVFLPYWNNYELEEAIEILDDGTSITKLVHVSKKTT